MSADFASEAPRCQRISSITPQITFDQGVIGGFSQGALGARFSRAATGRPKCPTRHIQTGEVDPQTQVYQPAPGWGLPSPVRSNRRPRASKHRPVSRRSNPSRVARCCPHQK